MPSWLGEYRIEHWTINNTRWIVIIISSSSFVCQRKKRFIYLFWIYDGMKCFFSPPDSQWTVMRACECEKLKCVNECAGIYWMDHFFYGCNFCFCFNCQTCCTDQRRERRNVQRLIRTLNKYCTMARQELYNNFISFTNGHNGQSPRIYRLCHSGVAGPAATTKIRDATIYGRWMMRIHAGCLQ